LVTQGFAIGMVLLQVAEASVKVVIKLRWMTLHLSSPSTVSVERLEHGLRNWSAHLRKMAADGVSIPSKSRRNLEQVCLFLSDVQLLCDLLSPPGQLSQTN
jgi:hypothetical protein